MPKPSADPAPRRRGRPSTLDREGALDAAVGLFWRHGYEGTSIADLTAAMGVTPPSLYAAFGSKEDLYRDALAHYLDREGERERAEAFRHEPSAYRAIEAYLRDLVRHFVNPAKPAGCMVSNSVLRYATENKAAADAVAAIRAVALEELRLKFDQAKRDGQLPKTTNPAALARFYSAIVQGMSTQACDGAGSHMLDSLVDVALAAWPGTRPRRPPPGRKSKAHVRA
jgi:TetR/AcrR family transcriptional regulator, copper-responsive repressor